MAHSATWKVAGYVKLLVNTCLIKFFVFLLDSMGIKNCASLGLCP
jgi:hypothetical protein